VNVFRGERQFDYGSASEHRRPDEDRSRDLIRGLLAAAFGRFCQLKGRGRASHILIVDDGGLAIESARLTWNGPARALIAMEQTRRGTRLLRASHNEGLAFPVINVAESQSKLALESSIIAESVVRCVDERLKEAGRDLADLDPVLVVGYGSVGSAVARVFRARDVAVEVADSDNRRMKLAVEEGFHAEPFGSAISRAGVVVGCTGTNWMHPSLLATLRGEQVILASASTADIEFWSAKQLSLERVPYPPEADACDASVFRAMHSSYALKTCPRHWILNGGFPCNFDGSVDPIPPHDIQLTRALILAGACSAVTATQDGLVPLPRAVDRWIGDAFARRHLAW
jgi:hypothetical protein